MTNSGTDSVGLDPGSTLLTYTDTGNLITLVNSATSNGVGETAPWWYSEWKLGTGNSLDYGEVVEITVGFFSTTDSTTTVNEGSVFVSSDTTLTVAAGGVFAVNDIIYLEDEQMTITAISTNDLTVTRGDNGTTATSHADGISVFDLDSNQSMTVGINEPFKVEIIPSQGAPFTITRTSPVEITAIMDLG
jgi:archaellin